MIKELNRYEIEEIEKKIETLKNNTYYSGYFSEDSVYEKIDKAFLVNDIYFLDFTLFGDVCFMGVINLSPEQQHNIQGALFEVLKVLKEQLKHYGKIYLWCYLDSKISMRFHNLLIKKMNAKQEIIDSKFSVIEVINA